MTDRRPINVRHSKPAFTNKFCGISGPIVTKIEMPDEDLVLVDGPPHRVISLHYNTPDGRPVHEYFEKDGPIPPASEVLEIVPLYLPQDRPTERATVTGGKLPPLESVDEPLPGNRFRYAGQIHEMRPVPWKLLNELWGQDQRDMHDVEEEIWEVAGGSQLKDAIHDLKGFLESIGYPRYVSKARRSNSLVWKAF